MPALSRRNFLVGTSTLGVAAGFRRDGLIGRALAQTNAVDKCPSDYWQSLADRLVGPLLCSGDSSFRRFAEPFNLAHNDDASQPTAIALCANRQDVMTAVNWARDHGISPVVRSGGHSYGGYSMGRGLMIDVSLLKRFSWNGPRNELTVECGARNGDVYNVLRSENRTTTHGRCPTVGIAGFLLGGGIGFNMRRYGVGSDHMVAGEIVTADGKTLKLSADENADLFWASRGGGGGNFGINTAFTIETVPASRVTVFSVKWRAPRKAAEAIALALMAALDERDGRLGSRFKFYKDRSAPDGSRAVVEVLGQLYGPPQGVEALLKEMPSPSQGVTVEADVAELDYWDGQDFLVDWEGPFRFFERSMFLTHNLDATAIGTAFEHLWELELSSDKDFTPDARFFQTGGRINEIDAGTTAFVHRDSRWLMDFGLPWSAQEDDAWVTRNRARQDRLFDAMAAYGNGHSYQNFVDPALENFRTAYYGQNLSQLIDVKRRYDPNNLFKFAQSIPLSKS